MADEKPQDSYCVPSQITINIGAPGVKVSEADPSKCATRVELAGKATKADVAAVDSRVGQLRDVAAQAAADAAEAKAAVKAAAASRLLVLDPGFPVPKGTASGTVVVRPRTIMDPSHRQFAPVSAWPRFAGVTLENDGLHVPGAIGFQPGLEQMLPSIGTWQIDISYTWKGNFDELEEKIPVDNVRTWDEFGNGEIKQDAGQRLGEITLTPGEHASATLRAKPTADSAATGLWAPRIQAPAAGFVVHGVSVDYVEDPA